MTSAFAMAASGCIWVDGGRSGDIELGWYLAGNQTCGTSDVQQVRVIIPGQRLQNAGLYGCTNDGFQGIRLLDFRPGTYEYTVIGETAQGYELQRATGTITVDGDVANDVTLQWTVGSLAIRWTFVVGNTEYNCYDAQVDEVWIDLIDDLTGEYVYSQSQPAACRLGGWDGAQIPYLPPGSYTILIDAYDSIDTLYRSYAMATPQGDTLQVKGSVTAGFFPTASQAINVVLLAPE